MPLTSWQKGVRYLFHLICILWTLNILATSDFSLNFQFLEGRRRLLIFWSQPARLLWKARTSIVGWCWCCCWAHLHDFLILIICICCWCWVYLKFPDIDHLQSSILVSFSLLLLLPSSSTTKEHRNSQHGRRTETAFQGRRTEKTECFVTRPSCDLWEKNSVPWDFENAADRKVMWGSKTIHTESQDKKEEDKFS